MTGATPLPDSGIVCGLPAAASVSTRFAERFPIWEGVNVTLNRQLAPAATFAQVVAGENSPSSDVTLTTVVLLMAIVRGPLLKRVISTPPLVVWTSWSPKATLSGLTSSG